MSKRIFIVLLIAAALFAWGCPKDDDDQQQPTQRNITVTSPNGGESWNAGSSQVITWTDNGVGNVTIQYSADGGNAWTNVAVNIANNHTYNWTVPSTPATTCKVKVFETANPSVSDVSDGNFAIVQQSGQDNASGAVRSDTSGVIETPGGARVVVPLGAVPRYEDGSVATQVFSIEQVVGQDPTLPAGETLASNVYRFGPEGFVFAAPVEVTIPMPNVPDSSDVILYRTNPNTNALEPVGATYDPVSRTARAQTYEFCCWFGSYTQQRNTALGCLRVSNLSLNRWLSVCVHSYDLRYPDVDSANMSTYAEGSLWAPIGTIGWASEGNFYLPQGTFDLCLQWSLRGETETYAHQIRQGVQINSPWNYWWNPNCQSFTVSDPVTPDTGRCNCVPHPTVPVRTGQVQLSLTWYADSPGLDLDLHCLEPDSNRIYYANPGPSASGGQLDRDNICGDFSNGVVENIFWVNRPPVGVYTVFVHFFGNCGSQVTSKNFSVRTVVLGNTQTFTRTISGVGTMQEITRFTISGNSVEFLPPSDEPVAVVNLPTKE